MAIAASADGTLLATGDKRAIADLANSDNAASCAKVLRGRLVTLEAVLWMLVSEFGAQSIKTHFACIPHHKTLKVVFSDHAAGDDDRCLAGIKSYFDALARTADGLLFNPCPQELGSAAKSS